MIKIALPSKKTTELSAISREMQKSHKKGRPFLLDGLISLREKYLYLHSERLEQKAILIDNLLGHFGGRLSLTVTGFRVHPEEDRFP
jgi:hypothetical protein